MVSAHGYESMNGKVGRQQEIMKHNIHELAEKLLHKTFDKLGPREKTVIQHIAERLHVSRNVLKEHEEHLTFGQHLADRVAIFGGSWAFVLIFAAVMLFWVSLNSFILINWHKSFDPYPYILLNLLLSMLAAVQAPLILMSQNRHAAKDRDQAVHDYEVNLKAELEIMALHQKMDALREQQWTELLAMQRQQIRMLSQLIEELKR